jgi:hypothetical protein
MAKYESRDFTQVEETALQDPEIATLVANIKNFLGGSLVLNSPNSTPESAEVSVVEGFRSLVPGSKFEEDFDSKPRAAGEIWISKYRDGFIVNIVVDPKAKQVIAIKELRAGRKALTGQGFATKATGIKRSQFTEVDRFVSVVKAALEGQNIVNNDPEAAARIDMLATGTSIEVKRAFTEKDGAEVAPKANSLGLFGVERAT